MAITQITVSGFKSIFDEQTIRVAPVTIFAGANSGGKSSASQPLLLLKQTIESQYDPGAMLLYGPNVKYTSADQVLSRGGGHRARKDFTLSFQDSDGWEFKVRYEIPKSGRINAAKVDIKLASGESISYANGDEVANGDLSDGFKSDRSISEILKIYNVSDDLSVCWTGVANRCFPDLVLTVKFGKKESDPKIRHMPIRYSTKLREVIKNIIHIRGLRGNPERSYLATARTRGGYPGAFEDYVASILMNWQLSESAQLGGLGEDLRLLGLTWKVKAFPIQDTHAEIRVGRLSTPTQGGANDMVSLADVGLGVSQILPFLVALRAAKRGQIVFVEQPEIHLHPRAQFRLAEVIAAASKRGVQVWIETHSSILIRGVQTLVATRALDAKSVALNWFQRDSFTGGTTVSTSSPDEFGRLAGWPSDFDDVSMSVDKEYLNAVTVARMAKK